jgi:hypothetical protein
VLTTNLAFADWHTVFPSATCATALVERVVHHADIVKIEGDNRESIPPLRYESKGHRSKFWKKGTVREMLQSRTYAGTWSFGVKRWRKDRVFRRRRYTKRALHQRSRRSPSRAAASTRRSKTRRGSTA